MAGHQVLITTSYLQHDDEVYRMLVEGGCDVTYWRPQDRHRGSGTLSTAVVDAEVVIAGTDSFSVDVIQAARALRLIARTGAGYDNVDVAAAARLNVTVCNTPGANRQSVAELALGLMMDCARGITAAVAEVQEGSWVQTSGRELSGSSLGVLGLGAVGKEVAKVATALGMRVLAYDPVLDDDFVASLNIHPRSVSELLAESDFVSLHIALNPGTYRMVDRDALSLMKPTAYLINTARGGIVDEGALSVALLEGRLAGAALDVLEEEPLPAQHVLRDVPNLLITPHIAGATTQARSRSGKLAATQAIDFLNGRPVAHAVDVPTSEAVCGRGL